VKSLSPPGSSRSRSSTVFSKNFLENLRVPIEQSIPSEQNAAELKILAQNAATRFCRKNA
jgi:hypothetical protein